MSSLPSAVCDSKTWSRMKTSVMLVSSDLIFRNPLHNMTIIIISMEI